MYFISFIRDYIELLNNIYDSIINDINIQKIIQESFIFLLQNLKFIIFYIVSFQWLRDFIYLPIILPKISTSILKENFFLEAPLENIFHILDIPSYNNNKFLIGFLNSFFLSLPLSCAHLIYIRRFLIQGNVAGIAAGLGTIIGQIVFIGSTILGFRLLVIPWFSLEPINYIVGMFLLLNIVYDMVHERVIKIIEWNNTNIILKIFFLNFLLIWTEQSCVFQFLGNITVGTETTVLDIFSSTNTLQFFVTHINYLLGLFIGSVFFNLLFALILKNLSEFIQLQFTLLKSTWIIRLNFILLCSILAFSFTSIPFYGLDYLLTGPLGFISNDKGFKNTIFSQNEVKDPFGILGGLSDNLSVDTDVTSFDKGFYLKAPILQTFEDLNFSGEYASTIRQGNIPLFDQYKEKARKIREIIVKKSDSEEDSNEQKKGSFVNSEQNSSTKLEYFEQKDLQTAFYDYPTYHSIDNNVSISSNIQKRFVNNYKESSNIIFENILQGTLNNVFADENFTVAYPEVEKKLKDRFYTNPVYKFLLTIDIDNFLNRQPKNYLLSSNEEHELYKKRLILSRYHDSLRVYNTLPYANEFNYLFNGSKTFADRVYNQQFKGTLHIVRRLFSISFDSSIESKKEERTRVLKYDQPLFTSSNRGPNHSDIHEEIREKGNIILKNRIGNEESERDSINTSRNSKSPFLELVSQNPFYIGWDEELRKVIITNRLLPRSIANFVNLEKATESEIQFSTWPINNERLRNNSNLFTKYNSTFLFQNKSSLEQLQYRNLLPFFEYEDKESGLSFYDSLPNNITKLVSGVVDVIPPNRGGFIWPGTSSLKFSFKDLVKM